MTALRTQNLGFPRIGARRELKRALERYWKGESTYKELADVAARLRKENWETQRDAGIDYIPSNDFSFYDQILDLSFQLGNVPARYGHSLDLKDPDLYFRCARGEASEDGKDEEHDHPGCQHSQHAMEMTKWFDTNYHYLVPEFTQDTSFRVGTDKIFSEYSEAKALGIETVPTLVGPLSYLVLGKVTDGSGFDRYELLDSLVATYGEILQRLAKLGATRVRLEEPALALDLEPEFAYRYARAYHALASAAPQVQIEVAVYFSEVRDNLPILLSLPVAGIHYDAARGQAELPTLLDGISKTDKWLSLGLIDGRNVWKTDLKAALETIHSALSYLGSDRLLLAPSCSLLHVPVRLRQEKDLDPEIADCLAFAEEKLAELVLLARAAGGDPATQEALQANERSIASRRKNPRVHVSAVRDRVAQLDEQQFVRSTPYAERIQSQRERLHLPPVPTTTIGSYPQTTAIRDARAKLRHGEWTREQYDTFLRLATSDCIQRQEKIGLDVLVHGEFERNDMVEYFGEQLDGFVFTRYGWVQSYGSRCVKPPILFGDVSRPHPMTVEWSRFAQSQTKLPMKGMLTGPVTILQWSFVRDDQPLSETAFQIALAIRDEVIDLEAAGLPIIQIDEAAFREGLPLRLADRPEYIDWAVRAFRLASSGVRSDTQIHTHMCYSEFSDMMHAIQAMDADVLTVENARSGLELLQDFATQSYPNEVGPGVYDIHSPRVPSTDELRANLERAAQVIPLDRLWSNPDCGLKTRTWEEVEPALSHMVEATRKFRAEHALS